jgi:hypothetical protein
MKPMPNLVIGGIYNAIIKRIVLDGLSPSKRVEALVNMESEKMSQNILPSDPLWPSRVPELDLVART